MRDDNDAAALRARHAGVTLPSEFGAGPSAPATPRRAPSRTPAAAFDVCHVGVVLRAVLFVHGVVAIGTVFGAPSVDAWLGRVAIGASVALPALVLWLLVVCACRNLLARLTMALQWSAVIVLGAASAGAAALLALSLHGEAAFEWTGPALAGGAVAAAIFAWLDLRAKAQFPADTTARLAELQSRIRPHFLFNTLNTALTLVRLDPARAEGVLEDLAELFRVAISDNAESVTLDEEVALAQRYLDIEQVRFGSRLHVNWELDPEAGRARVPPLLLQPLVENAVRHGIEPSPDGGVIRIRTRVKLGRAVVSIANSVPDEASRPGSGMALKNVKERLRLLHDVAAQFETRRDFDVFRVQIVVPL
ncbi:sensor histidine kinase [Piscinibacter koreensis]|uniref:Histidine kinase n=1 Tax=Piscinibacter koreensis TaxID=2742824 RepID=A0A7Y6NMP2_9BURK|nr:histidine kinase [Schlegelella koreensis]NUZ05964.1 histidine kinase [Schlegelella koreensis]